MFGSVGRSVALVAVVALAMVGCGEAGGSGGGTRLADGTQQPGVTGPQTQLPQNGGTAGNGAPTVAGDGSTVTPTSTPTTGGAAGDMPCQVASVVQNNCQRCHGETPVGGAIKLTTHEDWHRMSPLYDPTKQVYEVARTRINNGEMPQGGVMAAEDLAVLDSWLAAGALAAGPEDGCGMTTTVPDGTTPVTQPPVSEGGIIDTCMKPGAFDPPRSAAGPEETCYDFKVTAPGGAGPFTVQPGESYHEWYYAVPWQSGDVWTRFGADFDNLGVLHHYLVFTSSAGRSPGDVAQNVTGTTLGTSATLIGGWAVGGCGTILPDGVGGEIRPSPLVMIQWHMYNTTGSPQPDGSTVQICTVPSATRPNTAGITFLGTENFNGPLGMAAGAQSFTTRCSNNSGAPVTVIGFNPHMHLLGANMKTDLTSGGNTQTIFDMPFQFDYQVAYEIPPVQVMPGDTLTTTCSFFNDTGKNVAFGESTNQEMCYQFALSYPAGALDNGALSLIGALNTCW